MSGKSYSVKELLEKDHVYYEEPHKCRKIHWFYGRYQDMFKDLKKFLGHEIYFREGLPTFQLNLSDIDPNQNDGHLEMELNRPLYYLYLSRLYQYQLNLLLLALSLDHLDTLQIGKARGTHLV